MKKDITLKQYIVLHFGGVENFLKKFNSDRTYYRVINGEVKPQRRTIEKFTTLLEVSEKKFTEMLKREISERSK